MSEFKVGDEVEVVWAEGHYGLEIGDIYHVKANAASLDGTILIGNDSESYWVFTRRIRHTSKKEYIALKDMSIEAFCEATNNRDEWFCAGVTYLIEHRVIRDDEQIWIEQLDDFNREHPLFWQWLIDEGFIGEKEELKPCPFCGRDVKVYTGADWTEEDGQEGFFVGCSAKFGGCGCSVGSYAKEYVINKWNQRA